MIPWLWGTILKLRNRDNSPVEVLYCPYSVNNQVNLESFGIGLENKFTTSGIKPANRLVIYGHGATHGARATVSNLDSVSFLAPAGYLSVTENLSYLLLNTNAFLDVYDKYGDFPEHILCGDYVAYSSIVQSPRSIFERIASYFGRRIIEQGEESDGAIISCVKDVLGSNLSTCVGRTGRGNRRFFLANPTDIFFSYGANTIDPMTVDLLRALITREGMMINGFLSNYTTGHLSGLPGIGNPLGHLLAEDILIPPTDLCVINKGEILLSDLLITLHRELGISPNEVRISCCRGGEFTQRQAWTTTAAALSQVTSRRGGIAGIAPQFRENFINLTNLINRMNYRQSGPIANPNEEYLRFQLDLPAHHRESVFMADFRTQAMPEAFSKHRFYSETSLQNIDLANYKNATKFLRRYLNSIAEFGIGLKTDRVISQFH